MITGRKKSEHRNGNYGASKIQAKKDTLDLTKDILAKENLRIPDPDQAYAKLVEAYNATTDSKLKAGLWELLKRRKATLQPIEVKPTVCDRTHWDQIQLTR